MSKFYEEVLFMKHSWIGRRLSLLLVVLCMGLSTLSAKDFVVVIDPGHGGTDIGAPGKTAREKDINLSVALKLGKLIEDNMTGVKVVYTRSTDVFVTLQNRAKIANRANGDLFISIHVNSIDRKNPKRKTIAGASTYALGRQRSDDNLEVAKRENSVILLEEDYSTHYEQFNPSSPESYIIFDFMQSKYMEQSINFASEIQREFVSTAGRIDKGVRQAGFLVLVNTSMPSVLVELDFICNPTQEKFLASAAGQQKMAKSIYNAFVKYKGDYDRKQQGRQGDSAPTTIETKPATPVVSTASETPVVESTPIEQVDDSQVTYYKIQFMTTPKKLASGSREFKGLSPVECYYEGGKYKYTYGKSTDREELQQQLKRVKTLFKDAFIIRMRDGKRVK